jgi:hypothetical protein
MKPATSTPKQTTILSVKNALDHTTCNLLCHDYKAYIYRRNPEQYNDGKRYNNISAQNPILLTELEEPYYFKWDRVPFRQVRHEVIQLNAINSSKTTLYGLALNPEFTEFDLRYAKREEGSYSW